MLLLKQTRKQVRKASKMQKALIVASLAVLFILAACAKSQPQADAPAVSASELSEIDSTTAQVDQLENFDTSELDSMESELVELENMDLG